VAGYLVCAALKESVDDVETKMAKKRKAQQKKPRGKRKTLEE
jgi:hypothetical protein